MMEKGKSVKYKVNGKIHYGKILGFKEDKILVEKCLYSDFSGYYDVNTWIERSDIICEVLRKIPRLSIKETWYNK